MPLFLELVAVVPILLEMVSYIKVEKAPKELHILSIKTKGAVLRLPLTFRTILLGPCSNPLETFSYRLNPWRPYYPCSNVVGDLSSTRLYSVPYCL